MKKSAKQLYQLVSPRHLFQGEYVAINGPWDTYGVVRACAPHPEGGWLTLVRGCDKRVCEKPVVQF